MKHLIAKSLIVSTLVGAASVSAKQLEKVWEVDGLAMPESVVYDPDSQYFYATNMNQGPMTMDNNGSIARISPDGKAVEVEWVSGLSSPKGMDIADGKLYIADVREVVVVDIASQQITARFPSASAKVLNGLAINEGKVYVSDWLGNTIYTLNDNALEPWFASNELDNPNGLFVKDGFLYVNAWGTDVQPDFTTKTTGGLNRISLGDKTLESLTDGSVWMNLDGLHTGKKESWLATDFIKGQLLELNANADVVTRYDLAPSAADFFYLEDQDLIVVPYLMGNKVTAYRYN